MELKLLWQPRAAAPAYDARLPQLCYCMGIETKPSTSSGVPSDWEVHSHQDKDLVKGLGLTSATTLVMGSMIGSGIFIVSAEIAREVNSPALLIGARM